MSEVQIEGWEGNGGEGVVVAGYKRRDEKRREERRRDETNAS